MHDKIYMDSQMKRVNHQISFDLVLHKFRFGATQIVQSRWQDITHSALDINRKGGREMRKLRKKVLDNFCSSSLTRKQQDLFLCLCRWQNAAGFVTGIYYKDVCNEMGMTPQTFYASLRKLESCGLIRIESQESRKQRKAVDWNVQIMNNDCTHYKEVLEMGFVTLSEGMYSSPDFWKLTSGEKSIAMQLCRWCRSAKNGKFYIGSASFKKKFAEQLGVSGRTILRYLEGLKKIFKISRWKKNITISILPAIKAVIPGSDSDSDLIRKHHVRTACAEYGINIPDETALKDAADLEKQYPLLQTMMQEEGMEKYQMNPFMWLLSHKEYGLREDGGGFRGKRTLGPAFLHSIIIAKIEEYKKNQFIPAIPAPDPGAVPVPDPAVEDAGANMPRVSLGYFAREWLGGDA